MPPDESTSAAAEAIVETLRRIGSPAVRDGLARFGLPSATAFGIPMGDIRKLAGKLGRNHDLAAGLWETGWYEARLLAAFVDDPAAVTPAQMDRWCRDFDSWGVCDTICFHLFDRTPHAFRKVAVWATRRGEFQKRATLALHDRRTPDAAFAECLPMIEGAASDGRNFVKKGVSWALRGIGGRSAPLHAAAMEVAQRLAGSKDATERWIGKDAAKDLSSPATAKRLGRRQAIMRGTRR